MSWSFKSIGKTGDVAAEVAAMPHVPQPIKDLIAARAKGVTNEREGLNVFSHGHHEGDSVSTLHLEITEFYLAPERPQPPQPAQPESAEKPAGA